MTQASIGEGSIGDYPLPRVVQREATPSPSPDRRRSPGRIATAGALAFAVAVGGGAAFRAMNNGPEGTVPVAEQTDDDATDEGQAEVVAPPSPTDIPSAEVEQPAQNFDFTLRAEDYTGDPRDIVVDYFANMTKYHNTGVPEGAYTAPDRFATDDSEYAAKLNAAADAAYVDQVYDPDWEANEDLVADVGYMADLHRLMTRRILLSTDPAGDDTIYASGFKVTKDLITAVTLENGDIETEVTWKGYDNRHPEATQVNPDYNPNELIGYVKITFRAFPDGSLRVVDSEPLGN